MPDLRTRTHFVVFNHEHMGETDYIQELDSSAPSEIPHNGMTLANVDQYVLARMAEGISSHLAERMATVDFVEQGFVLIRDEIEARGVEYNPSEYEENFPAIYSYLREGNLAKFLLHPQMRDTLMATGHATLIAQGDIPGWAAQPSEIDENGTIHWSGQNSLGQALEDVRDDLRRFESEDYVDEVV